MTATNRNRLYYRTTEACRIVGISRSTLLRWFKSGTVKDVTHRDRRGWRLFTQVDIERIQCEADKAVEKMSPLSRDISEILNADDVKV
jgi:predicted site-specific integrase-resolvase